MAGRCTFQWDVRALPGDDPDAYIARFRRHCEEVVLPRIRKIAPTCAIDTIPRAGTPALRVERESPAEELARTLTGDNVTRAVAFAAEAGQFQREGLSTVICGPGSISQAHQPDEFITLEQVALGTRFLHDLVTLLAR
jgi:acetylornithine deacetylase